VTGIVFAVMYLSFNVQLIELFMEGKGSAEAINSGSLFLKTVAPFYAFIGIKLVGDGVLRGTGTMKLFMVATFTDLILRVVLAYVFSPIWSYGGIWWSWPIGWTVANILSLMFYFFF
jgi:Na+-driven multidrug efflux pump